MAGEFLFVQFGSGVPVAAATRFGNVDSALFIRFSLRHGVHIHRRFIDSAD